MRDIVLVSFTPLDAGGGVPRWNRDFVAGFPNARHYSWADALSITGDDARQYFHLSEWEMAHILNGLLAHTKKVKREDIVIADGFWGEWLSSAGYNVISVAHGIWSHLTKEDVDAGKQPEFPVHNAVQVNHRRDHLARGGKIVAVSEFIAEQMRLQWGFDSHVINNAVDIDRFKPPSSRMPRQRPLIIHGVTTANKGLDHIDALRHALADSADVLLLDEAAKKFGVDKYEVLGQADLVVQPSAYEGNSYFVLETLACGVPIVAYKVGLLYSVSKECKHEGIQCCVGCVIDRNRRSPDETVRVTKFVLDSVMRDRSVYNPRQVAERYSISKFHDEWRDYLDHYEHHLESR